MSRRFSNFITADIESPQTKAQQKEKSLGGSDGSLAHEKDSAAETHGDLRHESGFDIVQMFAEYLALRASIVKLWTNACRSLTDTDVLDLTRFNESIDQALAESVVRFVRKVDYSKDLLLGVLGHDIRSPIGAIRMSAQMMPMVGSLNEKQMALNAQMSDSSERVTHIVTGLLDLTRARVGAGLPIKRGPMDMGALGLSIVEEIRVQHPDRTIALKTGGDITGTWDEIRLGQVFSNLLGNAVQYGAPDKPISVTIQGEPQRLMLSIHNEGNPIAPEKQAVLFHSFTRGEESSARTNASNLGLGLFITKEIVIAHGGKVHVTSNPSAGTTFSVSLPNFNP